MRDDETLRENKYSLDIDHKITVEFRGVKELFNLFNNQFSNLNQKLDNMNAEMERLSTEVAEATTVMQSAATLIEGISQQIKDAAGDKAKLTELTNTLDSEANTLAAKVAENTPAAEEPKEPE